MTKMSRLMRLVREGLLVLIGFVKLIDAVIDLVNKAFNYAGQIPEFCILVLERTKEAGLRAQ